MLASGIGNRQSSPVPFDFRTNGNRVHKILSVIALPVHINPDFTLGYICGRIEQEIFAIENMNCSRFRVLVRAFHAVSGTPVYSDAIINREARNVRHNIIAISKQFPFKRRLPVEEGEQDASDKNFRDSYQSEDYGKGLYIAPAVRF